MKKDNRGLSLVELIIVMAIMAVLAGAVGLGVGLVSGKPADECANKLKSMMQNNRVTTMGKLSSYLELYVGADGCIYVDETIDGNTTTTKIGDAGVTVEYVTGDAPGSYNTLGTTPIKIEFNRSSGAFKPFSGSNYILEIKISKASVVRTLQLSPHTGKITMN